MRVGFDAGPINARRTGVGVFTANLYRELASMPEQVDLRCYASGLRWKRSPDTPRAMWIPLPTRALYALWRTCHAPAIDTLLGGVDLVHATNYFMPPVRNARRVVTIYDLAFLTHPHLCSPKVVAPFARNVLEFAHSADAIITCSYASRETIQNLLSIDQNRIIVAHGAAEASFTEMDRSIATATIRQAHGLEGPFILYTGTLEPRKNVDGLICAFAAIASDIPHRLVLVGDVGWNPGPLFKAMDDPRVRGRIAHVTHLPNESLPPFYAAADVYAFPSHCEGFGLPLVEAMACGCPVVAGDNSSMPEVLGDAGLLVPAHDNGALAEALRRLACDEVLRETLRQKGLARAQRFSWRDHAEAVLRAYRYAMRGPACP